MPEVVCDTSPLQYLHQLDLLDLLPTLATRVLVPPAGFEKAAAGIDAPQARHAGAGRIDAAQARG
ncbi:MAG TPA: hypothetical protein VEG34_14655 [Thermoanaerobaculia bacterium]|nr:hypothetical protein [Thermoanaerobaculia bacterium]